MSGSDKLVTPGLVVRELTSKENDRLITVLTAGHGLVTATAYGARRPGSSTAAGTHLFCYADFAFIKSRGYYKVDSAAAKEHFYGVSKSVEALAAASYFMQLLYDAGLGAEAEPVILRLGLNSLYALERGIRHHAFVKAVFELRLLAESGFEPELGYCARCGSEDVAFFNAGSAESLCAACAGDGGMAEGIFPLTPGTLDAMRYIVGADMQKIFAFKLNPEEEANLQRLCEEFTLAQMGRDYESLTVYKALG